MKKTVLTLEEAFRDGLVKIGDYIDYQPLYAECTFEEKDTGFEKKQNFSTEMLKWRLDVFEGKLILIATTATKQELTLKGKKGYDHGVEAQNELCAKLYTNPSISSEVVSTSEEIQEQLKKCNIIKMSYWLSSRCVFCYPDVAYFYVRRLYSGGVSSNYLCYTNGFAYSPSYAVRPVVFLKSDIKIANFEHADGSKENPWEICGVSCIRTGEKDEASASKVELMQLIQEGELAIKEVNKLLERAKYLLEKM